MAPADLQARMEAELASGVTADVIMGTGASVIEGLSTAGALTPPVGPTFSDPNWTGRDLAPTDDSFTEAGSIYAWLWNTDLVPDGIDAWEDFLALEPGVLGMLDANIGPNPLADFYTATEEAAPEGFFDELAGAGLGIQLYPGGNPGAAAVGAGEIGAYIGATADQAAAVKATGAPVDYIVYDNSWTVTNFYMVLADAPHPNAAQVFADWIVSKDGQETYAEGFQNVYRSDVDNLANPNDLPLRPAENLSDDEINAYMERWNGLFA